MALSSHVQLSLLGMLLVVFLAASGEKTWAREITAIGEAKTSGIPQKVAIITTVVGDHMEEYYQNNNNVAEAFSVRDGEHRSHRLECLAPGYPCVSTGGGNGDCCGSLQCRGQSLPFGAVVGVCLP